MTRSEFLVLLDDWFIVDCCEKRKKELASEWTVRVLAYGENMKVATRHCGIKPCLRRRR